MRRPALLALVVALVALALVLLPRARQRAPAMEQLVLPWVPLCERTSTIFVSVASYRDQLCRSTLASMFTRATFPARVFVGVYQQNDLESEACVVDPRFAPQVRVVTVPASAATGPCTARYQCSLLMRDEAVFLQVDSHSIFADGWDVHAIRMLRSLPGAQTGSAVISTYPVNCDQGWEGSDPPVIDKARYDGSWITFEATIRNDAAQRFVPSRQIGGGFLLCVADVVRRVPFDPHLAGVFNGEELLYTARLFTHGIDVVAPTRSIVCHKYAYAEHRTVWTDNKAWNTGGGNERADKLQSGLLDDEFGFGTARPLSEFWKHVGIDYQRRHVGEWPY
jgi:[Skp1-protein]-hydroxyproline N-acetylglucosaminyltransferase